jgi:DnaK suppressor protein
VKAQPKAPAKAKKPAVKAKPVAKAPAKKAAAKAPAHKAAPAKAAKPVAQKAPAKAAPAKVPAKPAAAKSAVKAVAKVAAKAVEAVKNLVKPAAKPAAAPPAAASRHAPPAPRPAPVAPAPGAFGSAKASYIPMANTSTLPPPPIVAVKKDPKLANNWKTKEVAELSDAEVLAMPDTEYMNEKQMAFFRLKLQQLKQDILNSAGETTEHLREETVIVPDPADRATIEEEHALELRTRDRERKLLKKIEQSIARIDAGDYGYCDETGEPIGVGRLLARPTATLSLEAQQRRELKQKMFGD